MREWHQWLRLLLMTGVMTIPQPGISQSACDRVNWQGLSRYAPAIRRAEHRYGLDAALISAVIQVESNFDRWARSPAGANGLMQLMPETARELNVRDPWDPRQNIAGGTRYLKEMIERFDDVYKALWAYNAGPSQVTGARLYGETRQYIPRVLSLYWCFKKEGGL